MSLLLGAHFREQSVFLPSFSRKDGRLGKLLRALAGSFRPLEPEKASPAFLCLPLALQTQRLTNPRAARKKAQRNLQDRESPCSPLRQNFPSRLHLEKASGPAMRGGLDTSLAASCRFRLQADAGRASYRECARAGTCRRPCRSPSWPRAAAGPCATRCG